MEEQAAQVVFYYARAHTSGPGPGMVSTENTKFPGGIFNERDTGFSTSVICGILTLSE